MEPDRRSSEYAAADGLASLLAVGRPVDPSEGGGGPPSLPPPSGGGGGQHRQGQHGQHGQHRQGHPSDPGGGPPGMGGPAPHGGAMTHHRAIHDPRGPPGGYYGPGAGGPGGPGGGLGGGGSGSSLHRQISQMSNEQLLAMAASNGSGGHRGGGFPPHGHRGMGGGRMGPPGGPGGPPGGPSFLRHQQALMSEMYAHQSQMEALEAAAKRGGRPSLDRDGGGPGGGPGGGGPNGMINTTNTNISRMQLGMAQMAAGFPPQGAGGGHSFLGGMTAAQINQMAGMAAAGTPRAQPMRAPNDSTAAELLGGGGGGEAAGRPANGEATTLERLRERMAAEGAQVASAAEAAAAMSRMAAGSSTPDRSASSAPPSGPEGHGGGPGPDGNDHRQLLAGAVRVAGMQSSAIAEYRNQMSGLQVQLDEARAQLDRARRREAEREERQRRGGEEVEEGGAATFRDDGTSTRFEIYVKKDTFKFNAAHFVAYPGFRERLHGHNYLVAVKLIGNSRIGNDGYVLDFGAVKSVTRDVCKGMNEYFVVPMHSDVLEVTVNEGGGGSGGASPEGGPAPGPSAPPKKRRRNNGSASSSSDGRAPPSPAPSVTIVTEDGSTFVFPRQDCLLLPLAHTTAEEFAVYLHSRIVAGLDGSYLEARGVTAMEVTVSEAGGQDATFRRAVGGGGGDGDGGEVDVRDYICRDELPEMRCGTTTEGAEMGRRA